MKEISRYVPITKAKNDLLELIRRVEDIDESAYLPADSQNSRILRTTPATRR